MTALGGGTGYLVALAVLAGATLVRWALEPVLGASLPLITYYLAVIAVAWAARPGPAIVTLAAGALLGPWLFAAQAPGLPIGIDLVHYFVVGGAVIAALEAMRRAQGGSLRHEALLSGIVRTALDAIVTIDHRDRIVEFNPAAERIFGYRRSDAIGRELADLVIPPALRERHRAALQRYLESGEKTILDRRIEITALRADGGEFPVELAVTRIPESDPPVFTAYLRDLTERRRTEAALRESEQRFRTLIDQVQDYAIFLIDLQGRAASWNEGVRRVLGFGEEEFLGLDVARAIFTAEDVALGVPEGELRIAAERGAAPDDRWMRRKDGSRFFAIGITVARRNDAGELVGYAKIMRDQTARKELEEELRRTAAHLSEVSERQSQFLAMLSHELRNPLAPIRNAVEILRRSPTAAHAAQATDIISRQVAQLVRLVEDLLDVNRIRQGKIHLQPELIDLASSLQHAIEIAGAQCAHAGQQFDIRFPDGPLWVEADATRIGQVISNLIHNACKFTPRGGRIEVSLGREAEEAVLRVRDSGMGIPPDKLEAIFTMFQQLDAGPGRAPAGLGIGLSLSRSLVELHGGSIVARSEGEGRGSEFEVRLPIARRQAHAA